VENIWIMDFDTTLSELQGLLGGRVLVEIRSPDGHEIAIMRGTLVAGDDLGDFERTQGVGGPNHDRLLFTMREHPFPEGIYLDRRTFLSAEWSEQTPEPELLIRLGGIVVVMVQDTAD
jgi:hypothetical protein